MKDLKDSWKSAGYSQEEVWFFKHNRELIEKLKQKRAKEAELKNAESTGSSPAQDPNHLAEVIQLFPKKEPAQRKKAA